MVDESFLRVREPPLPMYLEGCDDSKRESTQRKDEP